MVDILHKVGIKASTPGAVYKALTTMGGLAGWWTTQTSGSGNMGGVIEFRFGHRTSKKTLLTDKSLPKITKSEMPFQIPASWDWCRLGEAIRLINGCTFEGGDFRKGEGVPCVKITNVGVGEFVETDDTLPFAFAFAFAERHERYKVFSGDLLSFS